LYLWKAPSPGELDAGLNEEDGLNPVDELGVIFPVAGVLVEGLADRLFCC